MSKSVFITRMIPEVGIKMLMERGYGVDVYPKDSIPTQKEIISYLKKKPYDAVLSLLTDRIDGKVFSTAPSVKIYANYAIGFDNIDIEEAKKRGITVTNTPGQYASCIAEHAMAFILVLASHMLEADQYVRKGKYKGWSPLHFLGIDLKGKTLGLVGAGRIGEQLAQQAYRGFGMRVLYYDVVRNEKIEQDCQAEYIEKLDVLLPQADFVSLHVPLLDSTRHLMDEKRIGLMKETAYLINTSRGPVVDEKALVRALKNRVIAGAGLDVFEFEPKLSPGLAKLPNVVLTPHIASARESARDEMARLATQNIIDFFETGEPKNKVS